MKYLETAFDFFVFLLLGGFLLLQISMPLVPLYISYVLVAFLTGNMDWPLIPEGG